MNRLPAIVLALVCLSPAVALADDPAADEMRQDVILRAMVDELDRNMDGLMLEDLERPYFIEYGLTDSTSAYASASLGAVTGKNDSRYRRVTTDVRVGSYKLDNTNYGGSGYGGGSVPIEDDYDAIRQAIWWATDRGYKDVVEQFVKKKAFMESKLIEDKPDDFIQVPPTLHFEDRVNVTLEVPWMEQLAVELSNVFRAYPDVQNSSVSVNGNGSNTYLVNNEGTRLRTARATFSLSVSATVQADDGMKLSGSLSANVRNADDLPEREELIEHCQELATQLLELKDAPILDTYTGPVLFEPEAAASVFSRHFGQSFGGGQRSVGSRTDASDFVNKLNKRILPRFMSVVDDPTQEVIEDEPVMGHYIYDDQGVKAEAVSLVESGRLKTLLMSRNPSKEFTASNGHGRGSYGVSRGSVGCMIVSADPALGSDDMKQELLEACADEGLEFGLRIKSLGSVGGGGYGGWSYYARYAGYGGGSSPLMMYKVYPDGREELVRGAEIDEIDYKAFKQMLAAGDTPHVLNSGNRTFVVPALLFEELDLAKIDRDFDKPPILPTPLARQ